MGQFARRQRDRDDAPPHLPLRAGPISNGEFVPAAESSRDRAVNRLIRSSIDDSSRRLGMDRRRFLQGAGAVAASLAAFELAGCTTAGTARSSPTTRPRGRGGTFTTPPPEDTAACQQALASNGEFIFDVHTHHVIPSGPWVQNAPETVSLVESMLPPGCTDYSSARLCRPGHLPPRPVPGQRYHRGHPDRRPQLGALERAHPLHRSLEHPGDHVRSGPWRSQPAVGGEHHRPQRRIHRRHPRRDVERRAVGPSLGVQGLHGLESVGAGILAAGSDHRAPDRPARARSGHQGLRRPQGTPIGELRPHVQPSRRHGGALPSVPRHELRDLPRRLGPLPGGGSVRSQRHHRHRYAAGRPRSAPGRPERERLGRPRPPCGANSSPSRTRRPTPWANC